MSKVLTRFAFRKKLFVDYDLCNHVILASLANLAIIWTTAGTTIGHTVCQMLTQIVLLLVCPVYSLIASVHNQSGCEFSSNMKDFRRNTIH